MHNGVRNSTAVTCRPARALEKSTFVMSVKPSSYMQAERSLLPQPSMTMRPPCGPPASAATPHTLRSSGRNSGQPQNHSNGLSPRDVKNESQYGALPKSARDDGSSASWPVAPDIPDLPRSSHTTNGARAQGKLGVGEKMKVEGSGQSWDVLHPIQNGLARSFMRRMRGGSLA